MREYGIRFVVTILFGTIWVYHPLCFILSLILFSGEYIYMFLFLYELYRQSAHYYILRIERIDIDAYTSVGLGLQYNRINAFCRIYILLNRQLRFNWSILFILLTGFPYRIFLLGRFFFGQNKSSIRIGIIHQYLTLETLMRENKIEILDGIVYLNCGTVGKLITQLKRQKSGVTAQEVFNTLYDLTQECGKMRIAETSSTPLQMKLGAAFDRHNQQIYGFHYTLGEKHTIHQTSKVPYNLLYNQVADLPLPSAITPYAKNPGTIITQNVSHIQGGSTSIGIPESEIRNIQYNHPTIFHLSPSHTTFIDRKRAIISDVIISNLGSTPSPQLLHELSGHYYTQSLLATSHADLVNEIHQQIAP